MGTGSSIEAARRQGEPPRRVLIVANGSSGTGHCHRLLPDLEARLSTGLDGCGAKVEARIVFDHPQARVVARDFAKSSHAPSAIIAAGGGGTLRAVVEGVWDAASGEGLEAPARVAVGALRLGSGNVVAKQFGVPLDPLEAVAGLAASLRRCCAIPCAVMRCHVGKPGGKVNVRYGVAMCGLGQFGRTSGDLARWHRRLPRMRRFLARRWGIEDLNHLEYSAAFAARACWAAIRPATCERVELRVNDHTQRLRILAGVVMNLPIHELPFDPGVRIEEPALSFHYLAAMSPPASLGMLTPSRLAARATSIKLGRNDRLEIQFLDSEPVEFFLDEDPELAYGGITVEVAGLMPFIPCPEYFNHHREGGKP